MDNTNTKLPLATFTPQLVDNTPDIGQVLAEFMDSRIHLLTEDAKAKFGTDKVPEGAVLKILSNFVTEEDTRQPRSRDQLDLPGYPSELVGFILENLKQARIVQDYEADMYELTHDTLAKHLARQRDDETAALIEIVKVVKNGYFNYEKDKNAYLSRYVLEEVKKYEAPLLDSGRLSEEEWSFVEDCKKAAGRREFRRRRNLFILISLVIILGIFGIVSGVQWAQRMAAEQSVAKSLNVAKSSGKALVLTTEALRQSRTDPTQAWQTLDSLRLANARRDTTRSTPLDPFAKWIIDQFHLEEQEEPIQENLSDPSFISRDLTQAYATTPFSQKIDTIPISSQIADFIKDGAIQLVMSKASAFYLTAFKGSPHIYAQYIDTDPNSTRKTYKGDWLFTSDKPITDMALFNRNGEQVLWTGHQGVNVYEWNELKNSAGAKQDRITILPPYPLNSWLNEKETLILRPRAENEMLMAVDSIVYRLNAVPATNSYQAIFRVGLNRKIKHLEINPANPDEFLMVKDRSNIIYEVSLSAAPETIQDVFDNIDGEAVSALSYAPDGKSIFAAFEGEVGKLWRKSRPQVYQEFRGHEALITDVAFSEDGEYILTGSMDKSAILWDRKGRIIKRFIGHLYPIHSVGFLPGHFIYTSDENGEVRYWFFGNTAEKALRLEGRLRTMAVAPDTNLNLVAFSYFADPGNYYLWDFESTEPPVVRQQKIRRGRDNAGDIVNLAFCRKDGKNFIAVASENNLVTVESVETGEKVEDYRSAGYGIPQTDGIADVSISDEWVLIGNKKISRNQDRGSRSTINMALLRSRSDLNEHLVLNHEWPQRTGVNVVQFMQSYQDSSKQLVLTGCENGNVYIWDCLYGDTFVIDSLQGHGSRISSIAVSPKGRYILTGSYDNTAILWEWNTDKEGYKRFPLRDLNEIENLYAAHASDVTSVAIHMDEVSGELTEFLTASADQKVKLWKRKRIKEDRYIFQEDPNIISHEGSIRSAAYCQNGKYIITGSEDNTIKVWRNEIPEELIGDILTKQQPW